MAKSSVKTTTNKKNSCPQKTLNLIHYCEQKKLKIHRKRERESWKGNFLDVTTTFESRSIARKSRFKERKNKSRGRKETPLLFDKSKVLTKIIKLHVQVDSGRMDGQEAFLCFFEQNKNMGESFLTLRRILNSNIN